MIDHRVEIEITLYMKYCLLRSSVIRQFGREFILATDEIDKVVVQVS
jgi:hypothetical protein